MELINFFILNKNIKLNVVTHKYIPSLSKSIESSLEPKCILIHLHGLYSTFQFSYDNTDEFQSRIKYLSREDIISYGLEFNGHGKSDGVKGYIYDFDDYISDLKALVNYVKKYHNNIPIFLLAESMGGSVAIKYCILNKNDIKGIILLAPLCGIDDSNKPCSVLIKSLELISYIFPKLIFPINKNKNDVSENKEYMKAREENIYQYNGCLTLCFARELLRISNWIEENTNKFKTPVFLLHNINDKIVSFNKAENFYNNCKSENKTILKLNDNNHAILVQKDNNDIYPSVYMETITNWIKFLNIKKNI